MAKTNEKDRSVWVGFDLGGTKMLAVVYDSDFNVLGKKRRKTREKKGQSTVPVARITETIRMALNDANVPSDAVHAIGAGCPGPVDMDRGVIWEAPNLGWKNLHLQEELAEEFHCTVAICNDVDAGVFGEFSHGVAQNKRCVLGVFPGTGVGGGCVYEGRIFCGATTSCMEVGFIQMATEGPAAGLGPVGTLEALGSRLAIAGEAARAAYRGKAPALAREAGCDLTQIRSGTLSRAIDAGDSEIEKIVRRAARQIGRGAGSLVNVLAPDIIVIGGGLVEAMPNLYLEETTAGIKRNALPSLWKSCEIRTATLGDYATAIGAASWGRKCNLPSS
ncbi:MAG: ROK family protein [Fuerstiella sp.]|nr:ROK family protein [Fuerstiella sp.]